MTLLQSGTNPLRPSFKARYWDADGNGVVSVTDVIGAVGLRDYSGLDREMLRAAADRGHRVHAAMAKIVRGERLVDGEIPNSERGYVDAGKRYIEECGVKPILVEQEIRGKELGAPWAGRLDLFATEHGTVSVVDWKTTSYSPESNAVQVAAYRDGVRQSGGRIGKRARMAQLVVVELRANGRYKRVRVRDPQDALATWRAAFRVWLLGQRWNGRTY